MLARALWPLFGLDGALEIAADCCRRCSKPAATRELWRHIEFGPNSGERAGARSTFASSAFLWSECECGRDANAGESGSLCWPGVDGDRGDCPAGCFCASNVARRPHQDLPRRQRQQGDASERKTQHWMLSMLHKSRLLVVWAAARARRRRRARKRQQERAAQVAVIKLA